MKEKCLIFLVFCLMLLVGLPLMAAQTIDPNMIKFRKIGNEEGLSYSTITDIEQDKQGYMWFATLDGLNRYDGFESEVFRYDEEDSTSISSNRITSIHIDQEGIIWVGTAEGILNKYDPKLDKFKRYYLKDNLYDEFKFTRINDITTDKDGNIWLALQGGGVKVFDRKLLKLLKTFSDDNKRHKLVTGIIWSIYRKGSSLWFGTDEGLYKYNQASDELRYFDFKPGFSNELSKICVIKSADDTTYWLGTRGHGIIKFNQHDLETEYFSTHASKTRALSHDFVTDIELDNSGNVWMSTYFGLNYLNQKANKIEHIYKNGTEKYSLNTNSIWCLEFDDHYNLWIGNYKGGINFYNNHTRNIIHYRMYPHNNTGLNSNVVTSFIELDNGDLVVGTDGGGLNYLDRNTNKFKYIKFGNEQNDPFINNAIMDLSMGVDGLIYVASFNNGVFSFNPDTHEFLKLDIISNISNEEITNIVWCSQADRDGKIWFGTFNGLIVYDPKSGNAKHIKADPDDLQSLSDQFVWCIEEDYLGNQWIGTIDGLNMFDKKTRKFKRFLSVEGDGGSLSNQYIHALYEDSRKNLWIGTNGGGLNLLDRSTMTFTHYKEKDGLASNVIKSIIEDDDGYLWIGTNNGLSRFDPVSRNFKNFYSQQGLQSDEFVMGATYKTQSGKLLMGGVNGFNLFDPVDLDHGRFDINLYITDLKLQHKSVPIGKGVASKNEFYLAEHIAFLDNLLLDHTDNSFTFNYTAIHYEAPQDLEFAYRMIGLDDQWNNVENKRSVDFTNLDPGNYTFELKAGIGGMFNEENITSLSIYIEPPWWATIYFRIAATVLLFIIIITVFYMRTASIRKKKILLEKLVRKRTQDLESANQNLEKKRKLIETKNDLLVHQTENTIKSQRELAKLKEKYYEQKLAHRERELATNTFHIQNKNELLLNIKNQLNKLEHQSNSEMHNALKSINKTIESSMDADHDWNFFKLHFEHVHPDFFSSLMEQYPHLTSNELKQCAYIKMNLSVKEIANMLNITPRAVTVARNRLKKKMNLYPDSNLTEIIRSV